MNNKEIFEDYQLNNKTLKQLALENNCSKSKIYRILLKYCKENNLFLKIKIIERGYIRFQKLTKENKSYVEIAKEEGVTKAAVFASIKRFRLSLT